MQNVIAKEQYWATASLVRDSLCRHCCRTLYVLVRLIKFESLCCCHSFISAAVSFPAHSCVFDGAATNACTGASCVCIAANQLGQHANSRCDWSAEEKLWCELCSAIATRQVCDRRSYSSDLRSRLTHACPLVILFGLDARRHIHSYLQLHMQCTT